MKLGRLFLLAFFALHFFLVLAISCRDTFWLIGGGYTIIPVLPENHWKRAEWLLSSALGQGFSETLPTGEAISAYTHFAGIEAGYGYFAPNVPDSYKLVFELERADGHVEHDLPLFENMESTLRFATLLDQIGPMDSDAIREILIKLLAASIWQRHPDAIRVRAILGSLRLPDVRQFEAGERPSHEFMFAYDFSVTPPSTSP